IATLISAGLYCMPPLRVRGTVMLFIACLLVIMNFNLIVTILKPAYADTHLAIGEDQQYFAYPTPEINGNTKIGQTFIAQQNNLCSIRAMFSNSNNNNKKDGNLIFVLTESGGGKKILQQIEYPLNQIEDFTRYFFVFPPIADSLGKKYEFSFEVPSKISDSGIALWYETTNCSAAGQLLINNKTVPGILYFTAYHFIGDVPRTDWQGISATVIRQGWYITLPELQFYNERSKAFRCKTATHEKMIRFDKALNNRKVQAQKHGQTDHSSRDNHRQNNRPGWYNIHTEIFRKEQDI
ncbi:MAG: hypothetical protein NTV89_09035, partial [Proteobacteria bacterium]|nr:hypothetical protein [Pseudomonadota bacterium]